MASTWHLWEIRHKVFMRLDLLGFDLVSLGEFAIGVLRLNLVRMEDPLQGSKTRSCTNETRSSLVLLG